MTESRSQASPGAADWVPGSWLRREARSDAARATQTSPLSSQPLLRLRPLHSEGKARKQGHIIGVQRARFRAEDGLLGLGNLAML